MIVNLYTAKHSNGKTFFVADEDGKISPDRYFDNWDALVAFILKQLNNPFMGEWIIYRFPQEPFVVVPTIDAPHSMGPIGRGEQRKLLKVVAANFPGGRVPAPTT